MPRVFSVMLFLQCVHQSQIPCNHGPEPCSRLNDTRISHGPQVEEGDKSMAPGS